jgi:hypothetical protein
MGWRKASVKQDPTAIPPERALSVVGPQRPWYKGPLVKFGVRVAAVVSAALSILILRPGLLGLSGVPGLSGPGSSSSDPAGFVLVEPDSTVSELPTRFVWTRDPDAEQYRFELFDASSRPMTMVLTTDTMLVMDPDQDVVPTQGHWSVTPMTLGLTPLGDPISSRYRVRK